jgi:pimeloyl-ACP methyl ester carboxylesterase
MTMRRIGMALFSLLMGFTLFLPGIGQAAPGQKTTTQPSAPKKYDLVLLHGLRNAHRWSDSFLTAVANAWGSGRVYVIYANDSNEVHTRKLNGKIVTFIGRNDHTAGTEYIADWANQVYEKVQILQKKYGLSKHFDIIAHSQGGLVARRYIYDHPGTVAGLVTLGTPHHGSPLANDYEFAAKYIYGGEKAQSNLDPAWVEKFNQQYPVKGAPLFHGGKVYTIQGDADGYDTWGVEGENFVGWMTLFIKYHTDSDGLVPTSSAHIKGAIHLATYDSYDHLELVQKPDVAEKAATVLP